MLLGNPNIDEPVGKFRLEQVQSGAGGHAGGHGHDPAVEASQLDELAREVIGVVGRPLRCGGSGELGRGAHVRRPCGRVAVAGRLDRGFVDATRLRHGAFLTG